VSRSLVVANVVAALLFAASAALQWNDPDPIPWVALYGAAAVAALLHGRVTGAGPLAAAVAAVALGWGAWLLIDLAELPPLGEVVRHQPMQGDAVEELREAIGLGLVALWTGALAARSLRAARRRRPA
jgi:hypothetical protein